MTSVWEKEFAFWPVFWGTPEEMETSVTRSRQARAMAKPQLNELTPPDLGTGEEIAAGFIRVDLFAKMRISSDVNYFSGVPEG